MQLRPYQQEAFQAVMTWVRKTTDPCLLEAATGAGKSLIIAAVAAELHKISGGKRVLCIAPSAELVVQNSEKYKATGNKCSLYSASAGDKCLRYPVIFGTPQTVKNGVAKMGGQICAIIIDEAHGITPTIQTIIERIRERNANVRVIGLSATPYRLGSGYIYAMDERGKPLPDSAARDPYFTARVYRIGARELIAHGYLTPPVIGAVGADSYDTLHLELNRRGQFDSRAVDQAFHGHGRKTSRIIADVVHNARDRRGAMIFAATVQHAEECMASLPPGLSALVTGKTPDGERKTILERFKARRIKYLVNVAVLTTGFDAPHVDVIAILRATESVSLLQQIIGRGLRLDDGKDDCLVLDYAQNIERHCPDGDVFAPEVKAAYKGGDDAPDIEAECAMCGTVNSFRARPNPDQFDVDQWGYFLDAAGERIKTDAGEMPAHFGRRCLGLIKQGAQHVRCDGRWTFKECPHCAAENDIAARYCASCKGELIDPAEKLRIEFVAHKKDPTRLQTDEVLEWRVQPTVTRKGNEALQVYVTTPYRSFTVWLHPYIAHGKPLADYRQAYEATDGFTRSPETVTYRKNSDTGFYQFHGFDRSIDEIPG